MIIGITGAAKTVRPNLSLANNIAIYFTMPVNPNILNYNLDYI